MTASEFWEGDIIFDLLNIRLKGDIPVITAVASSQLWPQMCLIMLCRYKGIEHMVKLATLVLPTDFSKNAEQAFPYAFTLAKMFNAKIKLVHVFEELRILGLHGRDIIDRVMAEERLTRQAQLKELADGIHSQGIDVTYCVVDGDPATEVIQTAEAAGADCIVMATHGRTGLAHAFLGSVAERVVRLSPCPVLTVRVVRETGSNEAKVVVQS